MDGGRFIIFGHFLRFLDGGRFIIFGHFLPFSDGGRFLIFDHFLPRGTPNFWAFLGFVVILRVFDLFH